MMLPTFVFGLLAAVTTVNCQWFQGSTGNYTEEPRWCGRVYYTNHSAFDPGGQTPQPTSVCGQPLFYVQFKPRYSLYLDTDTQGEFVVKTELSQYSYKLAQNNSQKMWPCECTNKFVFSIKRASDGTTLVDNASVTADTAMSVFSFDLSRLGNTSLTPINVTLTGEPEGHNLTWTASSMLYYLPDKKNGSVTKIDNLNGGMLFKNSASNQTFQPLLAYGFYAKWETFLANHSEPEIQQYADMGLNAMTPMIGRNDGAWALDYMNKINLTFMFDLRDQITFEYQNLTYVAEKVKAVKDAEALFAYWSMDEPDGWQYPFNTTTLAADVIRGLDPYHPVADVLNCHDYYFHEYSAGADIIMEDVYPIGINSSFSHWGTKVNATLGDCGCDTCRGDVRDVPDRLDDLAKYERWLGLWPKTKFHCPQSFSDGGINDPVAPGYWARDPSPEEEYAMTLLALNHGAQSMISWAYPTTAGANQTITNILAPAHGRLARVIATSPVVDFLVGNDRPHPISFTEQAGAVQVDAAYWMGGQQALVCVVNGGNVDIHMPVSLSVPNATGIASTLWISGHNSTLFNGTTYGNGTTLPQWNFNSGELIAVNGLPGLSTSLFILSLN
ncbi:hypothetical protein QBC46DRAFT_435993 [Diplogelasinospora grovesii]|uniref:Glycoside hydrolase family 79 protein n=1 Tax=Diplogelasinospora grovesii TaxID=303347 RepID=A0AAN6S9V3_9PEZI|nr:hypothetical protein QBC46DRAFT_435993 [Diplogelasinospora grovesii]